MQLLSQKEVKTQVRKDNDELIVGNARLRKTIGDRQKLLNSFNVNYGSEKEKKQKDFVRFCDEILEKKSRLLSELAAIEDLLEKKKDIYYGFIEKQDELQERVLKADERDAKLDQRENFIKELERQWTTKTKS